MNNVIKFTSRNDREHTLPAKWEICDECDGNGSVDHPAFSNGITSSEWAEWDDDDRDYYMSGRYDVACRCCKGSGKVLVIDEKQCDSWRLKVLLKEYYRELEEAQYYDAMVASERRMGA